MNESLFAMDSNTRKKSMSIETIVQTGQ